MLRIYEAKEANDKMQATERIHAIKIQFKIPVAPEMTVDRFA